MKHINCWNCKGKKKFILHENYGPDTIPTYNKEGNLIYIDCEVCNGSGKITRQESIKYARSWKITYKKLRTEGLIK